MEELYECLRLSREIKEKVEAILELNSRALSPKNQVISDMPKGGGGDMNALDCYLQKKERLEKKKDELCVIRDRHWDKATETFRKNGVTNPETITLMWFRFYKGCSWKGCAAKMREKYNNGKWNTNKCFRVYREVLCKINNYNN